MNSDTGTVDIEINWEPNEINLHWYNGNTELTVPIVSQSCTYDSALIPPSTIPTKTGYTFTGWKAKNVPYEYTQLEYIQGNGTSQFIQTGYFPNNNTGVKTKIQFDSLGSSIETACFGGASSNNRGFECFGYPPDGYIHCAYGSSFDAIISFNLNDILEIDWNKNILNAKINDGNWVRTTFPVQTFTESNKMLLFALGRSAGVPFYRPKIKMFYFQLYDSDIMIHNFIPVKRKSDNATGMYDTVTKTFFTNAGTGDKFTAGPNAL